MLDQVTDRKRRRVYDFRDDGRMNVLTLDGGFIESVPIQGDPVTTMNLYILRLEDTTTVLDLGEPVA